MNTQNLINEVLELIKTPTVKDGTYITDWIEDGDTDDMTAISIAEEWDALPMVADYETDEQIDAELAALGIADGDEDIEHADTQFTDFDSTKKKGK